MGHVQEAQVLNIGPLPNADGMNISTNHGVKPDARFKLDGHISNDHCGLFNKSLGCNRWQNSTNKA